MKSYVFFGTDFFVEISQISNFIFLFFQISNFNIEIWNLEEKKKTIEII